MVGGRCEPKPANGVITDSGAAKPAIPMVPDARNPNPNPENLSNKGTARATSKEAQVDYGTGPMVRDPESRKYRRTRLFVMTLVAAASRSRRAGALWRGDHALPHSRSDFFHS